MATFKWCSNGRMGPSTCRFWYVAIHFWWLVLGGCKPNWEAEGPNKRHGNNVLRVKEHTEVMIGCKTSIIYLLLFQLTLLFINQWKKGHVLNGVIWCTFANLN